MTQDRSIEQQPEFRSQNLSPVSPKPVFFPQPSNIPILENQMDPSLSETSVYSGDAGKSQHKSDYGYGHDDGHGQEIDTSHTTSEELQQSTTGKEETETITNGSDHQGELHFTSQNIGSQSMGQSSTITNPQFNGIDYSANLPQSLGVPDVADESNKEQVHIPPEPTTEGAMSYIASATDNSIRPDQDQDQDHSMTEQEAEDATADIVTANDASKEVHPTLDIQALLDNIVNSASNPLSALSGQAASPNGQLLSDIPRSPPSKASNPAAAASLPPRPPTSDDTAGLGGLDTHSFQPSSLPSTALQSYVGPPGTTYQPLGNLPPPSIVGAPGTAAASGSLPPPPLASFQCLEPATAGSPVSPSTQDFRQRDSWERPASDDGFGEDDGERRWGPEVQKKYDAFLEDERVYVMKGEWEKFPASSRLFIGNLPTEKVTKRDLFHVFHKYGKLAQVSIKQAYGFVQFLAAQDCLRALEAEQGVSIRGRKIHLEISKPQRNKNQGGGRDSRNRRSRSPDNRGGSGNQKGIDRYRGGGDNRQRAGRRSQSPRSRGPRRSSPDRSGRRRSRSPLGRIRRDPSPRRDSDDDCPLPRRAPQDVPDVQIIAKDNPDRAFVTYVEKTFEARGVRTNVLMLSPRLPETSVMRRQIIEGVLAVTKLDKSNQLSNKFQLSVFDRSQGANNVRFEEYANLDLNICIELVLRAKQTSRPPTAHPGGYQPGPYGLPMAPQPPPLPMPSQQLAQSSQYYGQQTSNQHQSSQQYAPLDPNSIQSLLSRVQQPSAQQPTYGSPQPALPQVPDLSRLLASAGGSQQRPPQSPYPSAGGSQQGNQQANPFANLTAFQGQNASYNQPQQTQPQQYSPAQPVDMKNIMAGLARWKG